MSLRSHQWRAQPDDVAVQSAFADKRAALAGALKDSQVGLGVRLLSSSILYALDRLHQAHTAHVPYHGVLVFQLLQLFPQVVADDPGILRQAILINYLDRSPRGGAGNGVDVKG